jgi:hypothetical protein
VRRATGLALLLAFALPAAAAPEAKVEVKVISRRAQRVHLELSSPFTAKQARLAANATVVLQVGEGAPIQGKLLAVSSKYLVVEIPADVDLPQGAMWIVGPTQAPPEGLDGRGGDAPTGSDVRVGRRQPTLATFRAKPVPKRELVAFEGGAAPEPSVASASGATEGKEGDPGWADKPRVDAEGRELTRSGRIANEVRGDVILGLDGVADDEADVTRITPYLRVRLEVRQLGGSDRMRFRFFAGLRRPIDADFDDWTGERVDKENARFTTFVFEIESELPEHIKSFSDRIELAIGRDLVPGVLEAGIVDGARVGARFGSVTPFMFGGFAASNNPRFEDYDSLIAGGGIRLDHAFSHSGALRMSLAAAHERFRSEGQRDFIEAQGGLRLGAFGASGALVVDFYEPIQDKKNDIRLTTGMLNVYAQVNETVRVEAGYRERRALWQQELLQQDLLAEQVALLDNSARRNLWAMLRLSLLENTLDVWFRAEHYHSRHAREATGGAVGVGVKLNPRHRISAEFALRRRFKSESERRKTNDPFLLLSWLYQGESLMSQLSLGYRDSFPDDVHDRRVALRLMLDYDLGGGFSLRGFGEADFRRNKVSSEDGVATYLGIAGRYRF